MFGLALRSLRKRAGAFAATFLVMFLGAVMVISFGTMLDTAIVGDATGTAATTLVIMAGVVGGWGTILVIVAVTSTLTLSVRQRAEEMALLKSVGATPFQLGRMVVGEAAALSLVAWALAVGPGFLGGTALMALLHDTGQVPEAIGYTFGPIGLSMGLGVTVLSAVGAALITSVRTARAGVIASLADATVGRAGISRKRVAAGVLFLLGGLYLAVLTVTVMRDKETDAMATAGQADILAALGLALLAPWLIQRAARALSGPLSRLGVAGDLAVSTLLRRTPQMAAVTLPIILFTGIAAGTVYMQEIDQDAIAAAGLVSTVDQKNIATLNYVVIGMILLFTAVTLINTLLAATAYRRREFGQARLAGATRGQVLGAVALEGVLLIVIGLACGAFAATFTVLPFSIVRADTAIPEIGPLTFAVVAAITATLTMITALGAARRAIRTPAVEAVHT